MLRLPTVLLGESNPPNEPVSIDERRREWLLRDLDDCCIGQRSPVSRHAGDDVRKRGELMRGHYTRGTDANRVI